MINPVPDHPKNRDIGHQVEGGEQSDCRLPRRDSREHVNIRFKSTDTNLISNLAETRFKLDGIEFYSVEAFVQAIKYSDSEREGVAQRDRIAKLSGTDAKKAGARANCEIIAAMDLGEVAFVYWKGRQIVYRSQAHFELIERAIEAKFTRSWQARTQLLGTKNRILTHELSQPETRYTSLPSDVFCKILTKIRAKLTNS